MSEPPSAEPPVRDEVRGEARPADAVPSPAPVAAAALERYLHPLSWLFTLWAEVRKFALPAVAIVVAARWSLAELFFLPLAIPLLIIAIVRQLSLRYTLDETELIVRRSLLVHRSERHIPYARIHNLRITETPLHRLMHVVEVAIETASGTEPEATLRVLSRAAYDELRTHVAARSEALASALDLDADADAQTTDPAAAQPAARPGMSAARPSRKVILSFSFADTVTYGALDNRGFVIVGALAGLAWEAMASYQGQEPWDPKSWTGPWQMIRGTWRWLMGSEMVRSPLTVIAIAVAALLLLKLFSIGWALFTLHGFRVERAGTSLSVTHGLLTRASTVIPLHRIQQIKVREKPFHRIAGRVEVELDTVGGTTNLGQRQPVWLAPLAPRREASRLLAEVGAPIDLDAIDWQPVHPRAERRMRKEMLFLVLLATVPLVTFTRHPGVLAAAAVALPLLMWVATKRARRLAYAVASPFVVMRRGWIWRTIHITWVDRVQALAVSASPFDRRHDMATLIVDTAAGGAMGSELKVPYLGAATARALQTQLSDAAAATRFQW